MSASSFSDESQVVSKCRKKDKKNVKRNQYYRPSGKGKEKKESFIGFIELLVFIS